MRKTEESKMESKIVRFRGRHAFLSNFFMHEMPWISTQGFMHRQEVMAPSAEHCFQAEKARVELGYREIMNAETPREAKSLGRNVELRPDWESVKTGVMLLVVHKKFQNETMARLLIETGQAELIEQNTWHDNEWGDCRCWRCTGTEGKNMLGLILMRVRDELQKEG